jgi:hypothetical protein
MKKYGVETDKFGEYYKVSDVDPIIAENEELKEKISDINWDLAEEKLEAVRLRKLYEHLLCCQKNDPIRKENEELKKKLDKVNHLATKGQEEQLDPQSSFDLFSEIYRVSLLEREEPMDTEMTASAVIMGEGRMTEQEAIFMFETIKKAKRFTNTQHTVEAYTLAIQALKNEAKRKELIAMLNDNGWFLYEDVNIEGMKDNDEKIALLKKCEVSDG